MGKEEFETLIVEEARQYATSTVYDAANNMETVNVIMSDFIEGAWKAYYILKNIQ